MHIVPNIEMISLSPWHSVCHVGGVSKVPRIQEVVVTCRLERHILAAAAAR